MHVLMVQFRFLVSALQEGIVKKEEIALIIYMTFVVVILSTMVVVFFVAFQKRKNQLLLEKIRQQKEFEDTVSKTSAEIQEQTLKYVGQELHDNIGQLLSLASMQMGMLAVGISENIKEPYLETQKIIRESLAEVRTLSKALNTDIIQKKGLVPSLEAEILRLNRMKVLKAYFDVEGQVMPLPNQKDGILIFRIFQEFISNTIKHAKASELRFSLNYDADVLTIIAQDNGEGFDIDQVKDNSGLLNMRNRAKLTQATFDLTSQPQHGTQLTIKYPMATRALADKAFL